MPKRSRECLHRNWTIIVCPDCERIKKGVKWIRFSKEECLSLNQRISKDMKNGGDVDFILESCGCIH